MMLKSFIAKAAVIAILSGVVYAPANYLNNDVNRAIYRLIERNDRDPVINENVQLGDVAKGWIQSGGLCMQNTLVFVIAPYDTEAECHKSADAFNAVERSMLKDELIYGRIMVVSGLILLLSLASISVSLSFVGLRKLWNIGK